MKINTKITKALRSILIFIFVGLIACSGISFSTQKAITLYGDGFECNIRNYSPSGDLINVPKGEKIEVLNLDSCTTVVHLWGAGCKTDTKLPIEKKIWKFKLSEFKKSEKIVVGVLPVAFRRKGVDFDLIQPRHIYAPLDTEKPGHIFMPASLLVAGARLHTAGCNVSLYDENISPYNGRSNLVGINLVGSPYIPVVYEMLKNRIYKQRRVLLGGQLVNSLGNGTLMYPFSDNLNLNHQPENGNNDTLVGSLIGSYLISPYDVSLIPMYERISDTIMREYLSHEFSFFLSQGCKFACKFCSAVRTHRDSYGEVIKVTERYRNKYVVENDLDYLMERAEKLGINSLNFYLTNLDVFQTPKELHIFAETVLSLRKKHPTVKITMRGLATTESFISCAETYPKTVELLREAGYVATGFGIDGMAPLVWSKLGKKHNYSSKDSDPAHQSIVAVKVSKEFGITPEILMVFGHPGIDTKETLNLSVSFTKDMVDKYGAVPRPHVAKHMIPGNDFWRNASVDSTQFFLRNPWMFQTLDFCALASTYTHGSKDFVDAVNNVYLQICEIPGNTTNPIYPIEPLVKKGKVIVTKDEVFAMKIKNEGRYDR